MKGLAWRPPAIKRPARSKYGNIKTELGGVVYDSKKEAEYARTLEMLKHAKDPAQRVVAIERQVAFPVVIKGKHICKYVADFVVVFGDGRQEVIDVKGMRTAIYKLKKKLVEALHEVEIKEV